MTYEEANGILRGIGLNVRSYRLENDTAPFISMLHDEIILDGEFTADQLEAISMWMRNPVEVMSRRVILFQNDEPSLLLVNVWPSDGEPRAGRVVNGEWNWPNDVPDMYLDGLTWADATCIDLKKHPRFQDGYNETLQAANDIPQSDRHKFSAGWEPAPPSAPTRSVLDDCDIPF